MIALTGAGSFAEATITDTEVKHTWKFGRQEEVRRDACNIGDKRGVASSAQHNNEALESLTESLELDQGVLPQWK